MSGLLLDPLSQLVTVDDSSPSISVLWDKAVQLAVVNVSPGPTIASRAYGILHTAMFDAWASYDTTAKPSQDSLDSLQRPDSSNTDANKTEAMSFAAYRILSEIFPSEVEIFDALMTKLGFSSSNTTTDTTTPAGIGNTVAETLMKYRREDGSGQLNKYQAVTDYPPVNSFNNRVDITAWTPELVPIDAPSEAEADRVQNFLTPHWGKVIPFGLKDGADHRPNNSQPFFAPGFEKSSLNFDAKTITLPDGSTVAVSSDLVGHVINPGFIEQAEAVVAVSASLTDEQKLIAEFWEDGGGTSFPPGTWMSFGQFVSARDEHTLDEDAVLFFALGNAVFDAGIATWESKVAYDYVRPVRAIRDLGSLGLIGETGVDAITGETGYVIEAWGGPGLGTQTILAENFLTYQTPGSDPSPPFAEYTSGHSAFSAAGATILELFTGSEDFGASLTFETGTSRFEPAVTPTEDVTLSWDTFDDAADEGGISRIYGGIHFEEGDLNGRQLGEQVGQAVWKQVQYFLNGGEVVSHDPLHLYGTDADETLEGKGGNDYISGNGGQDLLVGGDGDDQIYGGNQADRILGGAGDDKIYANGGADVIDSGTGQDEIWLGGNGAATVVLSEGEGYDLIANFQQGMTSLKGFAIEDLSLVNSDKGVRVSKGDDLLAVVAWKSVEALSGAFVA